METNGNKNATKHYLFYPEGDFPAYLAYGFRPIFLLLAPYIILSIVLWGLSFSGVIPLSFIGHPLEWHIYEFLFGVGSAGIMAFLFTGLPELFPGVIPIVGKRLQWLVSLWLAGRFSFWVIDFVGVYLVAILNIALFLIIIAYAVKPVLLDPLQRHASIGYTLLTILGVQCWFFLAMLNETSASTMEILKVGLGVFMILVLFVLRRVNMEAINEILEDEDLDDTFIARPFRYNISVFMVAIFTIVEFISPENAVLGWLGFAVAAAVLGILNDFILEEINILFKPFVIFLMMVLILMATGYGMMGYSHLFTNSEGLNHLRHFLTTGAFGLSFYLVMVTVSYVHTGRPIKVNFSIMLSVLLLLVATFLRTSIFFLPEYIMELYIVSSIVWAIPFVLYMVQFFPYLIAPRMDGIPG